jgi:TetR/AcrR family transcriptional regulator
MDNTTEQDQTTEERILAAAKKIFIKQGMAGARMQDIADEAGINKAMLHYYFRSKEKLFGMIFAEVMGRLIPKIIGIFNSDEPLFKKIEDFCEQYISTVIANPYIPAFIIHELNREPKKLMESMWRKGEGRKPALEKILIQIEGEVKKGNIKPIEPFQLVLNIMSLCIFPFVGKPIIQHITGMSDENYMVMLQQRRTEVSKFIITSITT